MKNGSQWYHMDDSYVEPVKERTVLRQKDAYVLFYCRKEVKLNLPTPPSTYYTAEEAIQVSAAKSRQRSRSLEDQTSQKDEVQVNEVTQTEAKSEDISKITKTASNQYTKQKVDKKKQSLTLDQGSKRGSVEVVLRKVKNKKVTWKPTRSAGNDEESGLLGNTKVSKWDEDDESDGPTTQSSNFRAAALKELKREERNRKRKMYLDSWDAGLDKGRTKKVKQKKSDDMNFGLGPKQNQFHRIQNSMMQMNRKGHNGPFNKKKRKRW